MTDSLVPPNAPASVTAYAAIASMNSTTAITAHVLPPNMRWCSWPVVIHWQNVTAQHVAQLEQQPHKPAAHIFLSCPSSICAGLATRGFCSIVMALLTYEGVTDV